jgi:hypothetical protein
MKTVAYSSPMVPPEWIAAHGLRPWRVLPGQGNRWLENRGLRRISSSKSVSVPDFPRGIAQGVCPFSQAFMDEVSAGSNHFDAVILATTCDQMRRAGEMLSPPLATPAFLMNVPATWQSPAAIQMYQDELRRLGRFLLQLGGQKPSDPALIETMRAYQNARQNLLKCQEQMPARRFVERIFQLCQSCTAELCDVAVRDKGDIQLFPNGGKSRMSPLSLAVVGGLMTARDLCVLDMIEQGGGRIVLNASESGQRCLPAAWGNRGLENRGLRPIPPAESVSVPDSPLATLAAAYFGAIPDAFRRPDDLLYEYLRRELAARAVRGIVFVRQAWCDLWHAQAARMRAAFALPLLDLDVSCPDSASVNLSNRIQSFLEVLR